MRLHRRVIYQAVAWAPIVVAAAITTGELQASTNSYQYQTRAKRPPVIAGLSFVHVVTAEAAAPESFVATSHQIISRAIVYEESAYAPFTPAAAEVVTVDKWFSQLGIPTRRKTLTAEEGSIFGSPPRAEANDQVAWHKPLGEPQRLKRLARGGYQFEAPAPFPQVPWGWYEQLDLKHALKRVTVGQVSLQFVAAAPGSGVAYNWFSGLDEPLRIIRSLRTDLGYGYFTPVAETVTVDKWWQQPDLPVRRKTVTAEEGSIFSSPPPPILAWGWYGQLDRTHPLRRVSTGQVALQFVAAAPGAATEYNWFQPIDWPTRARKLYEFPATSIPVYFVPPVPGAGNEYNWFQPLDEPVRPRPSIRTAQQWPLTIAPRLLAVTLENAWHQRLNEPVRLKATFGQYPGWTAGNVSPVVPLAWSSIDEPRRFKRVTRFEPAESYFPTVVAETITIDKWWRELVRPTRIRPGPQQLGYTFVAAAPGAGVAYNWFASLDIPTRLRKSRQSDAAYGYFTPVAVAPSNISFVGGTHQIISRSIIYEERAYTAFTPGTPGTGVAYNWFQALDIPVRRRRSIQCDAAYVRFIATPGAGVAYNWFQSLDVPTRRDRRRVAAQQFAAYANFLPARLYFSATTVSAQVFRRAILFDHEATPPIGISLPNVFQQTVTINVTVAFNRMLRYACKAEETDAASTQAEGSDQWVTQAETVDASSTQAEGSDPWSTQTEDTEDWDEEDQTPESGCP